MMMKIIDIRYILTTYNQLDIFATFLSYFRNIEGNYIDKDDIIHCINHRASISSPFRIDENPSVGFYYDGAKSPIKGNTDYCIYGKLKMRDFTTHRYSISNRFYGDCFDLVKYMLLISNSPTSKLDSIAKIIDDKMKHNTDSPILLNLTSKSKERKVISIYSRKWNLYDQKYWTQFGFTSSDLTKGLVYPVEMAWINYHLGNRAFYTYNSHNPCYAYYYGIGEDNVANITLYFPYANKKDKTARRFITNNRCFQGINTLTPCKYLILTKSYKDVLMIRKAILYHLIGSATTANSIAVPSENYNITQDMLDKLKIKYNIDTIFSLFDNDMTGKRYTIAMFKQTNMIPLLIPSYYESKDLSDLYRDKGQIITNDLITNFINSYL